MHTWPSKRVRLAPARRTSSHLLCLRDTQCCAQPNGGRYPTKIEQRRPMHYNSPIGTSAEKQLAFNETLKQVLRVLHLFHLGDDLPNDNDDLDGRQWEGLSHALMQGAALLLPTALGLHRSVATMRASKHEKLPFPCACATCLGESTVLPPSALFFNTCGMNVHM